MAYLALIVVNAVLIPTALYRYYLKRKAKETQTEE